MMKNTFCQTRKPDITYPCKWEFRLIGRDSNKICLAVSELIEQQHQLLPSNSSKGGKYHSLCLDLMVESEEIRNRCYQELKNHPDIIIVI